MKTSKNKCLVAILFLTFGVLFIGVFIVVGILFFNEKTIVVDGGFIQDAVDEADPGDIILVKASGGPYEEEVTINKDNIKLIGIGKEKPILNGTGMVGVGITINNPGAMVQNFIIQNFATAIRAFDADGHMIKGNNVKDNGLVGLFIDNSDNNVIKENTVTDNGNDGIFLASSVNNMIKENSVKGNEQGMLLNNESSKNIIKGNIVNSNTNEGIRLEESSSSNMIKGNTVNDNNFGISLSNSTSNMINRNTINENGQDGIFLISSTNNMMTGNRVKDNGDEGILLSTSDSNIVKGNTVNDNGQGILLNNVASNNIIKGNKVNNNVTDGIQLTGTTNNNDVFFNRAFGNGALPFFDIENFGTNNFKGNKCDTSNQPNICN